MKTTRVRALTITLVAMFGCCCWQGRAAYVFTDLGTGSVAGINNSGVLVLNENSHVYRVSGGVREELKLTLDVSDDPVWSNPTWGDPGKPDIALGTAINDAGHIV